MGIFDFLNGNSASGKVSEIQRHLNTVHERTGEFFDLVRQHPNGKMDASICNMFGELFDKIYKLYAPNKVELDKYQITIGPNRFTNNTPLKGNIAHFIAINFKMALSMEDDFGVKIFKDYMQREFAKAVMPSPSSFMNGLR